MTADFQTSAFGRVVSYVGSTDVPDDCTDLRHHGLAPSNLRAYFRLVDLSHFFVCLRYVRSLEVGSAQHCSALLKARAGSH